jgi:hypothetical protein
MSGGHGLPYACDEMANCFCFYFFPAMGSQIAGNFSGAYPLANFDGDHNCYALR